MLTSRHSFADLCEELKVASFAGLQWIAPEVRDDHRQDHRETSYLPLERLIAAVRPQGAAVEVTLESQQYFTAIAVLADRQTWPDLSADTQCRSR